MDSLRSIAKRIDAKHNVCIRILDEATGEVVSEHEGHNASTNSMLVGIAHYLLGDGVLNQKDTLRTWVPLYISLGTMGLNSQLADDNGLPLGIGPSDIVSDDPDVQETKRFQYYMAQCPGYGADGYDGAINNNRPYFGLGPSYENRQNVATTVDCELISSSYGRAEISYRELIPEDQSSRRGTIDIVLSTFVSLGSNNAFMPPNQDYLFITEAGLWSKSTWNESGDNGLLAGYRIVPPHEENWDMTESSNRQILKENIIRVNRGQVIQVVWKLELGGIEELGGYKKLIPDDDKVIEWNVDTPTWSWEFDVYPFDAHPRNKHKSQMNWIQYQN